MTWLEAGLVAQGVLAGLAVAAAVLAPPRSRPVLAGGACTLLAAAGTLTGALAVSGSPGAVALPVALPLDPLVLQPDRLGGVFVVVAGAVGVLASLYAIGYASGPAASRTGWTALAAFLLGLQMVPAAADLVTFLLAWELMAVASTALVLAEHEHRPPVRSAALWYAVMTHLSLVLLLAGFAVLATEAAGTGFGDLATVDPRSAPASVAFVLLVLGFASKAGIVPLHVWLPRAHPEAPSHASALMSAAMVKMGVYGALLVGLRLLPGGPAWWGVLLVTLGGLSALYGILQAAVATDLKQLLAYSTTENVGLMFLALGASMLFRAYGVGGSAGVAVVACLLLVVSHAAFKATLFLGAGAVLHGTGVRDLDHLGGLGRRMPWTAATFGVASLGAAALPVTAGFVAEWVLLQSLIHAVRPGDRLIAVVVPLSLAVVALTAGLALLTFVKAYGLAFLARPRSPAAETAHEATATMRVAGLLGALAVAGLGFVPGPVTEVLARAAGIAGVRAVGLGGLELTGVDALLDPLALVLLAALVGAPVAVVAAVAARRAPRERGALAWGCGGVRVSPRMQYTATSYAEPLMRVFDDALQPTRDVEVTHVAESRYLVARLQYRQRLADVVEVRGYRPAIVALERFGELARSVQNGSIHRYLGFSFAALVAVLVVVAR